MQLFCCTLDNTIKSLSMPKIMHGVTIAIDSVIYTHVESCDFREVVYLHNMADIVSVLHVTIRGLVLPGRHYVLCKENKGSVCTYTHAGHTCTVTIYYRRHFDIVYNYACRTIT